MFEFGVSNLRRIKNTKTFDMKKITLLIGRNSSGKSTFLRSFPLLRQSIVTRTSAPILWFGDFVDFGDFDNAVSEHDSLKPITFSFGVDTLPIERVRSYREIAYRLSNYFIGRDTFGRILKNVKYSVDVVKFKNRTRISKIIITIEDCLTYELDISESMRVEAFFINKLEVDDYKEYFDFFITADSIFPIINVISKKKPDTLDEGIQFVASNDRNSLVHIYEKARNLLSDNISARVSDGNKNHYTSFLLSIIPYNREKIIEHKNIFPTIAWKKFIEYLTSSDGQETFLKFQKYNALHTIISASYSIRSYFTPILASVLYIGPARAKSDRYYRYQDLSVSEIDPNGANFPMFLNSLSEQNLKRFSDWVQSLFGYGVDINKKSNHISIILKYDNDNVNVIDTGYGVSQILPVLGQVWWAKNRPIRSSFFENKKTIVAVEQPELHLHPAHQALLADAFVSGIKSEGKNDTVGVSYIIETHSEALINRLGELIYKGNLSEDDVQILIFEQDDEDNTKTIIKESYFDSDGDLQNWPYGFFVPEAR